jgi:hypothetical protein
MHGVAEDELDAGPGMEQPVKAAATPMTVTTAITAPGIA